MKVFAGIFGMFFLSCAFAGCIAMGSYNGIVSRDEAVSGQWSEVQNQLKRRSDMTGQLVETVKGYAAHEAGIFTEVAEARASVGRAVNVDASTLANDPVAQKRLADATAQLGSGLSRLLAVSENYPNLKANESFMSLQATIEGTENRIAVARGRAIEYTKDYNRAIRQFPTMIVANFGGFVKKDYYEATEAEQQVPAFNFTGTK